MKGMNKRILSIFILFLGLSVALSAQTKDDVVNTYNKGVEMAKTDAKAAVAIFEEALEMAKAVGLEADDIKQLIESQIPALQLLQNLGYTYLTTNDALRFRGNKTSNVILEGIFIIRLIDTSSLFEIIFKYARASFTSCLW